MKNVLVFSQLEARNYLMYTRNGIITVRVVKSQVSVTNLTSPTWIETYCELLFLEIPQEIYIYGKTVTPTHFPVYRSSESVFQAFLVVENHERSTFRRSEILIFIYY